MCVTVLNDMKSNIIKLLINRFNEILDKIFKLIMDGKITPSTFNKLTLLIKEFINFSRNILFPMLSSYTDNSSSFSSNIERDINQTKEMIFALFDDIEEYINDNKANLVKDGKIDTENLKKYFEFIGVLMNNLFHILLATISYASGGISENEYDEMYLDFKSNLEHNQAKFKQQFE